MSDIIRDITEIARCGAQYKVDTLSPMGLKGCHASYLSEICANPGISQDKLSQRICINKSNVARQAAILEEDGADAPHHPDRGLLGTMSDPGSYRRGSADRHCHFGTDEGQGFQMDGGTLICWNWNGISAPTGDISC